MMAEQTHNWYIRRGKEVRGPFPAGLISRYLLVGRVHGNDEVSHDRSEWRILSQVPELVPEIMRLAQEHPDDEQIRQQLEAARRWADERRDPHPAGSEERRHGESMEVLGHRDSISQRRGLGAGQRVKPSAYLLVLTIAVVVVAIPFLIPSGPAASDPDCNAPPAPAVNWANCPLRGVDLANRDLSHAILRNADLTGAVLRASNLAEADLAYADLTVANLRGANLNQAHMKGANLRNADLTSARLSGADLSYADLTAAQLEGVDLSAALLDHAIVGEGVICLPGSVGECHPGRVER